MANTLLSPTIITREALRVLHANLNFVKNINRQYDSQFANSGASPSGKIGPTLTIRKPNRFTVRTGAVMTTQDVAEETTTLTVSTQKGIDLNFFSSDLTLTIDEFSKRYINPAMAQLATSIEQDALSMYKDVFSFIDHDATAIAFVDYMNARRRLNETLAPDDGERIALMCPEHNAKFVNANIALLRPDSIGTQYTKGEVIRTAGMKFFENSVLTNHQTGTAVGGDTLYNVSAANYVGSTITVDTGATTFLKGDAVTLDGCYACHPETKVAYSYLQPFTITADTGTSTATISVSPSIVTSGAKQNVSASPTSGGAVTKLGSTGSASLTYVQSLVFHPDAFTFVSADLVDVSKFGAWGAREVMDGISMRLARQYDITNDKVPSRIDVLYGYKTIRPELACRVHADG